MRAQKALLSSWIMLLATACPDFIPRDDARITCTSQADCPTSFTCEAAVGRCLPNERPDTTPPDVVTVAIDPERASGGDVITIAIEVDEVLDRAPALTLGGEAVELAAADGNTYTYRFTVPASGDEGERSVDGDLVDVWANVRQKNLGAVFIDYTAPVASVAFSLSQSPPQTSVTTGDVLSAQVTAEASTAATGARLVGEPGARVLLTLSPGAPVLGADTRIPLDVDLSGVDLGNSESVHLEVDVVGARPDNASPSTTITSAALPVDLTPPADPSLAFEEGDITSDATVTALVAAAGALYVCIEGDIAPSLGCVEDARFAAIPPDGRVPLTLAEPEGVKTVTATFMDGALARSAPVVAAIAYIGDGVVESEPELVLPVGQTALKDGDVVNVRGSAQAGAVIVSARILDFATDVTVMDVPAGAITLAANGSFGGSFTLAGTPDVDEADGVEVALEVIVAVGPVASAAEASRTAAVPIDNVAPQSPSITVADGAEVATTTVRLSLFAAGATEMLLGGDLVAGPGVGAFAAFQSDVTALLRAEDGLRTLEATYRDRAHNIATAATTVLLDRTFPSVNVAIASRNLRLDGSAVPGVKANDVVDVAVAADADVTLDSATLLFLDAQGAEIAACEATVTSSLALVPSADGLAKVLDPNFDTVRLSPQPCANAESVTLRVLVRSPGGALSLDNASRAAPLFVDDTPPVGSATIDAEADALPGFTRSLAQTLNVSATDDRAVAPFVRFTGDIAAGARVGSFVELPGGGTELVTLNGGAGQRTINVAFSDEVGNIDNHIITLTLDQTPPATPFAASLVLREVPPTGSEHDPAFIDDAVNTFTLEGLPGAVAAERAFVYADAALSQRIDEVTVNGDGSFALVALPSLSTSVFLVAVDDAGNQSVQRTLAVPVFSAVSFRDRARNGDPFTFTFNANVDVSPNPTVTIGDGTISASFVSKIGNSFTYTVNLDETNPLLLDAQGVDRVVVRVSGAAAGFGANNQGTDAILATLDFTPPTIADAQLLLEQRASPDVDRISGLVGAVADDAGDDPLPATSMTVHILPAAGETPIAARTPAANGSFAVVDVGDDSNATIRVRAIDEAGNRTERTLQNDIADPVIANVAASPNVLRDGIQSTITFTVTDANGTASQPAVTVGGVAATFVSVAGALPTQTFTYRFTATQGAVGEGTNAISVSAVDPAGNAASNNAATVVIDFTAPSISNVEPGTRARWNANTLAAGNASDNGGSALATVAISLQRASNNLFLQADNTFSSATAVLLPATGTTSWTRNVSAAQFVENESYRLRARATDGAGNTTEIGPFTFVFDRQAPNTTITAPPAAASPETNPVVAFACDQPPCTFACSLDGAPPSSCTSPLALSNLALGAHTFSVAATDEAGNADPTAAIVNFSIVRRFLEISQSPNSQTELACGISQDHALWCWGENFGRINNSAFTIAEPFLVDNFFEWAHVAVGRVHICATTTDGDLYCQGDNSFNQLGIPAGQGGFNLVDTGGFGAINAADSTTCALRDLGGAADALFCWGANFSGEAGVNNTNRVVTPTQVTAGPPGWTAVQMGEANACGIGSDGQVYCWGSDNFGSFVHGTGVAGDLLIPTPIVGQTALPASFVDVGVNELGSCAVASNGELWCWGANSKGQAGLDVSTVPVAERATNVAPNTDWTAIERDRSHTCGLRAGGRLVCFGSAEFGERGDGLSEVDAFSPTQLDLGTGFDGVFVGIQTSWFRRTDGTMLCVGKNNEAQCGVGVPGARTTFAQVATSAVAVTAGHLFTHVLDAAGNVLSAGENTVGQLDNTELKRRRPAFAAGVAGPFTQIGAGFNASCGIRTDQTMACWGSDDFGQLGAGSGDQSLAAQPVLAGTATDRWIAVSAGQNAACGILQSGADGLLRCWGFRLETGTVAESPTAVNGDLATNWLSLDIGGGHACGVRADLSAACWGLELNGRLGNGFSGNNRRNPQPLPGSWSQVVTGDQHGCGLQEGEILCWGGNDGGQLGTGVMFGIETTPKPIVLAGPWESVAAGAETTCGVKRGGFQGTGHEIYCWGRIFGAKGSGTPTPTLVATFTGSNATVDVGSGNNSDAHAFVILTSTDGASTSLHCIGDNAAGQLGDGGGFILTPTLIPEP